MAKFKILSLDGGGIRGVLSARLLKEVETIVKEKTGEKLHEYFDLIAGTSTGSMLAAGVACQKSADEIMALYKDRGDNIFLEGVRKQRKSPWSLLGSLFWARGLYPHEYKNNKGLTNVLKEILVKPGTNDPATIADIQQPELLILAYNVETRNTTWFTSGSKQQWYYENKVPLWKICSASAAAPTFFPPYKVIYGGEQHFPYIDGGVADNNPTLSAIAHALSIKEVERDIKEIAVLSIGTGNTTRAYTYQEINKWGLLNWVSNIGDIFMYPDSANAVFIANNIFKNYSGNYMRLDFDLGKGTSHDLDDPEICEDLIKAAESYLEEELVQDDRNIKKGGYYSSVLRDILLKVLGDKAKNQQQGLKVKDAIEEFIVNAEKDPEE